MADIIIYEMEYFNYSVHYSNFSMLYIDYY